MFETADFETLREKAGLTIEEVANLLGKSSRTIRRYEARGERGVIPPALVVDVLRRAALDRLKGEAGTGRSFTFIDLFAGIGGLRTPFEEIGGHCVFTA